MLSEEAPGAQKRGSPLLWMEGEQGEDGRPGAGGGGWRRSHPRGTGRLRHQPGWAGFFPALSAEPGRHRPPRAHPSLCLLLAREPRFRGAFSRQTLQGRVLASCSHLPLTPQLWPVFASGHLGSSPTSLLVLVWAHYPPERRWGAAPGPASVSCAGPTAPSDPASWARGSTRAAWPSGLSHRAPRLPSGCFCPNVTMDMIGRLGVVPGRPSRLLHPVVSPSQMQLPVIYFLRPPRPPAGVG